MTQDRLEEIATTLKENTHFWVFIRTDTGELYITQPTDFLAAIEARTGVPLYNESGDPRMGAMGQGRLPLHVALQSEIWLDGESPPQEEQAKTPEEETEDEPEEDISPPNRGRGRGR